MYFSISALVPPTAILKPPLAEPYRQVFVPFCEKLWLHRLPLCLCGKWLVVAKSIGRRRVPYPSISRRTLHVFEIPSQLSSSEGIVVHNVDLNMLGIERETGLTAYLWTTPCGLMAPWPPHRPPRSSMALN